jgi:hypothetical protein
VVAGSGFIQLAQSLIDIGASYGSVSAAEVLSHPTTVSRRLTTVPENKREQILPEIKDAILDGCAAGTTDLWTDDYKKIAYSTMTVHYISKNWELKNRVLFTCDFPLERKTGANIEKELIKRLIKIRLSLDLFKKLRFVTDRGANVIKALKDYTRFNCCCHVINTVLSHTFNSDFLEQSLVSSTINASKSLVTYMKQSGNTNLLPSTLHQQVDTR